MATNFSPCKGSYVLNQFPSNVMFAMNGFTYQPVERYRAMMALLFHWCISEIYSLSNHTILNMSQLKASAYDKLFCGLDGENVFDRTQNLMGNGENTGYQHFLHFPQCFQKHSSTELLKVAFVW